MTSCHLRIIQVKSADINTTAMAHNGYYQSFRRSVLTCRCPLVGAGKYVALSSCQSHRKMAHTL